MSDNRKAEDTRKPEMNDDSCRRPGCKLDWSSCVIDGDSEWHEEIAVTRGHRINVWEIPEIGYGISLNELSPPWARERITAEAPSMAAANRYAETWADELIGKSH